MPRPILLLNASRTLAVRSLARTPLPLTPLRSLTTTSTRYLATPQTGPQRVSAGPIRTPNPDQSAVATNEYPGSRHAGESDPNAGLSQYPDYSKGPSALDKASQLFFFTEIFRGMYLFNRDRRDGH